MQTHDTAKPAEKSQPAEKSLPAGLSLQIFDDGSAICPSRTTPGKAYALRFYLDQGRPVVTGCDCQAGQKGVLCWHTKALLAKLRADRCPQCGARMGVVNLYLGGRGYAPYDICQGPACDYLRRCQ